MNHRNFSQGFQQGQRQASFQREYDYNARRQRIEDERADIDWAREEALARLQHEYDLRLAQVKAAYVDQDIEDWKTKRRMSAEQTAALAAVSPQYWRDRAAAGLYDQSTARSAAGIAAQDAAEQWERFGRPGEVQRRERVRGAQAETGESEAFSARDQAAIDRTRNSEDRDFFHQPGSIAARGDYRTLQQDIGLNQARTAHSESDLEAFIAAENLVHGKSPQGIKTRQDIKDKQATDASVWASVGNHGQEALARLSRAQQVVQMVQQTGSLEPFLEWHRQTPDGFYAEVIPLGPDEDGKDQGLTVRLIAEEGNRFGMAPGEAKDTHFESVEHLMQTFLQTQQQTTPLETVGMNEYGYPPGYMTGRGRGGYGGARDYFQEAQQLAPILRSLYPEDVPDEEVFKQAYLMVKDKFADPTQTYKSVLQVLSNMKRQGNWPLFTDPEQLHDTARALTAHLHHGGAGEPMDDFNKLMGDVAARGIPMRPGEDDPLEPYNTNRFIYGNEQR
jgi:hypothetical protein